MVTRTAFPKNSVINQSEFRHDYGDSFSGVVNDEGNQLTAVDMAKAFFSSGPKWIEHLFNIRNKIVSVFGLKTSDLRDRESQFENFKFEPGARLGLFKVFATTPNEIVLGEDDSHLNFRVSLFIDHHANILDKKSLTISTIVEFNNWFGRLYFLPVRPFHKLIVPAMLKGIINELEKRNVSTNAIKS